MRDDPAAPPAISACQQSCPAPLQPLPHFPQIPRPIEAKMAGSASMPDYMVYVYTPDMFEQGLPAENSGGNVAVALSASKPLVLTLKPGVVPIAITIRDEDGSTVRVNNQNWTTSNQLFNETSLNQHILGGSYHPGSSINAAYTLSGATAWNGAPLSVTTYRLGGNGPDTGAVHGLIATQALVPGQSYSFTTSVTTQGAPIPYPNYYDPGDPPPPCFASGTRILTTHGALRVEDLRVGDMVMTMDNGYRPLVWITSRRVGADELHLRPELRPVRIAAGSLGPGLPETDLVVSPQHRVLIRSRLAERMFADREVLVAAKHLAGLPGIAVDLDMPEVTYWHFLFDGHQIVFSNGAPTESLFTGPEALRGLTPGQRQEIETLFPDSIGVAGGGHPARQLVPGRRGRSLARRLELTHRALIE